MIQNYKATKPSYLFILLGQKWVLAIKSGINSRKTSWRVYVYRVNPPKVIKNPILPAKIPKTCPQCLEWKLQPCVCLVVLYFAKCFLIVFFLHFIRVGSSLKMGWILTVIIIQCSVQEVQNLCRKLWQNVVATREMIIFQIKICIISPCWQRRFEETKGVNTVGTQIVQGATLIVSY